MDSCQGDNVGVDGDEEHASMLLCCSVVPSGCPSLFSSGVVKFTDAAPGGAGDVVPPPAVVFAVRATEEAVLLVVDSFFVSWMDFFAEEEDDFCGGLSEENKFLILSANDNGAPSSAPGGT